MKKNRLSILLFSAVIFAVIIYSAYGMVNQGKEEDYISVSVIVNDSSSERWDAFREGLEQGAEDNHVHLNLVSTGKFQNVQEEQTIVKRELDGSADGVIVAPYSSDTDVVLPGETAKLTVLIQTGIETDTLFTTVMTDHVKFGETLGDMAVEGGEKTVGIFSGNQNQLGMRQRLKALKQRLSEAGVEIAWVISDKELYKKMRNQDYFKNASVDAVLSLENDDTEKAVDLILNTENLSWHIYGEGRSEKLMYYLDKGTIRELLVPNEYYMGYQSMCLAAQAVQYHTGKTEQTEVDFFRVTKDNLYDEETSRILFPTVR